jgi:hypothetical protein
MPYSDANLHAMAKDLNLHGVWFHKNHYDIPMTRKKEIMDKCTVVSPKDIVRIIRGEYNPEGL